MNELFPPTEAELQEIISELEAKLSNESHETEWHELAETLKEKSTQLKTLILQNNHL